MTTPVIQKSKIQRALRRDAHLERLELLLQSELRIPARSCRHTERFSLAGSRSFAAI